MTAIIELNLFSGLPNPAWTLDERELREILAAVEKLPLEAPGFKPIVRYDEPLGRPRSGYRGFSITIVEDGSSRTLEVFDDLILDLQLGRVRRDSDKRLEKALYALVPRPLVTEVLNGMTHEEVTLSGSESAIRNLADVSVDLQCPTAPNYRGNTGVFRTFRQVNNCYNYATNVLNKVPLQAAIPGNPNMRVPLTMAKLRRAVEDDGLIPLGLSLDGSCPPEGTHYVAILLRRSPSGAVRDFHCLRLDRSGTWSHKDGKGEVRNVDDNGNKIVNLATAALSWEPELAGFYKFPATRRGNIG